jgi:glycosyltransferase involved in cell wall biosynthesis
MLFVPRLQKLGHEVAVTAFYGLEGGVLNWNGIPVYPRAYHPYGNDIMGAHAVHWHADVMISLIDAWVYEPAAFPHGLRWAPWFPIDHDPAPRAVLDKVSRAWARLVYSKFSEQQVKAAGLDCFYIPHGVDTEAYKPGDRAALRAGLGWPDDKFVCGMIAANKGNPSRKSFVENILAFKALKAKHPDALLYLHTVAGEENGGPNLREFLDLQGLSFGFMGREDPKTVDVLFNDQYTALIGLNENYMNAVYNSLDALLMVTMGEGFGIPLVEAQAAGCPVITGDWTANAELCFSGWKVSKSDSTPFWTPLASWQFIPHVGAITERLEAAYRMKDNQTYRDEARKGALPYDADRVTERYWKPALEQMQSEIDAWKPQPEAEAVTA